MAAKGLLTERSSWRCRKRRHSPEYIPSKMLDIFFFSPAPVIALCEFWHWKELLISCYCPVFSVQCSNPILAAANADQCQPVVKSGTLWTLGQDFKGGGMWQRGLVPGVRHAVIRPEPKYKTAHKIQCHLLATHSEGVTVMLIADTQEWQGETSASNQVQKIPWTRNTFS